MNNLAYPPLRIRGLLQPACDRDFKPKIVDIAQGCSCFVGAERGLVGFKRRWGCLRDYRAGCPKYLLARKIKAALFYPSIMARVRRKKMVKQQLLEA